MAESKSCPPHAIVGVALLHLFLRHITLIRQAIPYCPQADLGSEASRQSQPHVPGLHPCSWRPDLVKSFHDHGILMSRCLAPTNLSAAYLLVATESSNSQEDCSFGGMSFVLLDDQTGYRIIREGFNARGWGRMPVEIAQRFVLCVHRKGLKDKHSNKDKHAVYEWYRKKNTSQLRILGSTDCMNTSKSYAACVCART